MKYFILILTALMSISFSASAHPGRTDANGYHIDAKTGRKHKHSKSNKATTKIKNKASKAKAKSKKTIRKKTKKYKATTKKRTAKAKKKTTKPKKKRKKSRKS